MRALDWERTPLGEPAHWPVALRLAISLVLGSRHPMFVWWGPKRINLYNDAYAPILGGRHPAALGAPAQQIWPEIWDIVGPQSDAVFAFGEATWNVEVMLAMERRGFWEEAFFTWSYSPVRNESGEVAGMFCACTEETGRVLSKRRLRTLREVAAACAEATGVNKVCVAAARALAAAGHDVPFAFFYLRGEEEADARLAAVAGIEAGAIEAPTALGFDRVPPASAWPLAESGPRLVDDLAAAGFPALPGGPWAEPARQALILPLAGAGMAEPAGFLVAGVSPRLELDEEYRGFFSLLADTVAASLARSRAFQAEQVRSAELNESQTRLRFALESGAVSTWLLDVPSGLAFVDEGIARIFGIPIEECADGLPLPRLTAAMHPEDRPRVEAAIERSADTGVPYALDYRVRDGAGGERWVHARGQLERDAAGQPARFHGILFDITERRAAEAILRASRDQFQAMADAAPAMLWITEPDGACTFLSRSWYEFTGQTREEGYGLGWTNAIHPDEHAAAGRAFIAASAARALYAIDFRLRRADGEYRWVVDAGRPRFGESGEFLGFIGSVVDIHERKLAEAALAERAAALRDADRRKDEFLAMLAHELRNPLSSVTSAAALLRDGADDGERAWAAEVITRQSGQLARLVDDLLDVSRITRGTIVLRRVPLDVARAVAGACEAVAPLIAERAHTLLTEIPRGELWVEADPARLEQILGNLLANAARYTAPRGHLELVARREEGQIVLALRDTGVGIEPHRIPEMFELFAQGERGIARSEGGLGIGLTVVRALCELHGGSVEAYSDGLGTGSTFTVRLPAIEVPVAGPLADASAAAKARSEGAGARLLVVDDNADTAAALARLLIRRGYATELANDGPTALEKARTFLPSAVLLDIGLPGMDGYEVARRLRAEPWGRALLIVAISGYGQEEDRARSRVAGFDHHLVKPVDLDALSVILVERLLSGDRRIA